jgi:hypothetical protein
VSLKAGSELEATVSEAVPAHIFEPGDRTDTRPKRDIQGIWEHLNKRGSPGYDGVRALINDWYARIPQGKGKRDLFDKLVSKEVRELARRLLGVVPARVAQSGGLRARDRAGHRGLDPSS